MLRPFSDAAVVFRAVLPLMAALVLAGCISGPSSGGMGRGSDILMPASAPILDATATVAIVDGPLWADYPGFQDRVDRDRAWNLLTGSADIWSTDARSGAARHGTAVGAQIVESEAGRLAGPVHVLPLVTVRGAIFGSEHAAVAEAVRHAARIGVPVINLSLNGRAQGDDDAVGDAIRMATAAGSIVVTTAGNLARATPQWPATMATDPTEPAHVRNRMIVVGCAVDATTQCRTSNRAGPTRGRYLLAIGDDVSAGEPAAEENGTRATSFAAPKVAALAASIATRRRDLTPDQVVSIILETADPVTTVDGRVASAEAVGHGLANPKAALRRARIL